MAKAIFTVRPNSVYNDLPEFCYHFPKRYLRIAQETINDWIIYYEPSRSNIDGTKRTGRLVYYATARVVSIEQDPNQHDHYYVFVDDFLQFDRAVPLKEGNYYFESSLQQANGKPNYGITRQAMRKIEEYEYDNILRAGFNEIISELAEANFSGYEPKEELEMSDRPLIQQVVTRPFRDAAFSKQVKKAYNETCAITGIKLINGGARAEAQAAHIRPVTKKGPDSVRNGIALSSTIHWMFDRGLISIDDDYSILVADVRVPDTVMRMISSQIRLPKIPALRPHPQFLQWHRENVFHG